ncbi:MAG TPA: DJ-1/PfpI family protein [Thermoleophilaceae bacterium]|jgi:putative intracellular protease/amidase|nr:DJ-1/PfpI family protein [Thermoleophilaceae bacterium]
MKIAIPIFDRVTALDAIGPYEVLSRLPGAELKFVGLGPGAVRTDNRMLSLNAEVALEDFAEPDILVFPGGIGTRALMKDERVLDWVRCVNEGTQWTTSVCTGSLVLAAAGLLQGLQATTHWAAMDTLERLGAKPTARRVVEQGKIVTAAGVSSGIDMALRLAGHVAGDQVAQAIQLGIEYDPQPPYDSGSPGKATPEVIALVRRVEEAEAQAVAAV